MSGAPEPVATEETTRAAAPRGRAAFAVTLTAVAAASAAYFAFVVAASAAKPVWYDEIFTTTVSRLDRVEDVWSALKRGTDLNPPLSYLMVRASTALLGPTPLAARLPSAIGFWVAGLCLLVFVGRRCGRSFGWGAALFPAVTSAAFYATEARPYGLVLGSSAFALVCWQALAEARRRPLAAVGLATGLATAVSSHYYAVLAVVPLAAGELVRARQRKQLDPWVAGAVAAGLAPLLAYTPLIQSAREYATGFWGKPGWMSIADCYVDLLRGAAPPLVALLALATLNRPPREGRPESGACPAGPFPRHESVAAVGFALLPVVGVLLAKLVTGAFAERYVVGSVIGLSILTADVAYRVSRGRATAGLALTAAFGLWILAANGPGLVRNLREVGPPAATSGPLDRLDRDGAPVLVSDSHLYLELVDRLPTDLGARLVYAGPKNFVDTIALRRLGLYRPIAVVDDLDRFLTTHSHFYSLQAKATPWSGWLLPDLLSRGARVSLDSDQGGRQLFRAVTDAPVRPRVLNGMPSP